MTYPDTSDEARQCARESLCEACDGRTPSRECERICDDFHMEAVKIQNEMEEEVKHGS